MLAVHYRLMQELATCCAHVDPPFNAFHRKYGVEYTLYKPVDLEKLDRIVGKLLFIEPVARFEGPAHWLLEVMNLSEPRRAAKYRVEYVTPKVWKYTAEVE